MSTRLLPKAQAVESLDFATLLRAGDGVVIGQMAGEPLTLCERLFGTVSIPAGVSVFIGASITGSPLAAKGNGMGLSSYGGLFRTAISTVQCGLFGGPLVVSMRPFAPADVDTVSAITAAAPLAHGAPVHVGDPAPLGIADLSLPDYGEPLPPEAGEVPMYWACGLTGSAALEAARLPIAITHAPGCMVVTDLPG